MKVYKIKVNGKSYRVELEAIDEVASAPSAAPAAPAAKPAEAPKKPEPSAPVAAGEGQQVLSPIQGAVVKVVAKEGSHVKKGDVLLVIEAMKLENDVVSPFDGEVAKILVEKGQTVTAKEVIALIK